MEIFYSSKKILRIQNFADGLRVDGALVLSLFMNMSAKEGNGRLNVHL